MSTPKHSKLSPSKAYQWTACTASIGYIEANRHRLKPERPSPAAIEGTKAHNVAEAILMEQPVPDYATKDMVRFGNNYAGLCRERMGPGQHCHDWAVERRVPLFYLPEEAGTVDFSARSRTGVHIVDYKYGYGKVRSEGNKQMAIYATSLITVESNDIIWPQVDDGTPVTMTIYQPRLDDDVVCWETTWKALREFAEDEIAVHARTILATPPGVMRDDHYEHSPKVHFAPSEEVCKYCPCASFCEARTAWMLDEFQQAVGFGGEDALTVTPAARLSDEMLVQVYRNRKILTDWLDEVENYLSARTFSKEGMPGMKLVMSKGGHRYWQDEKAAAALLTQLGLKESDIFTTDIVSPAQAEKLTHNIKDKRMQELFKLMAKPPGKPVIALEADPRPAWQESVLADFDGIDVDS